MQVYHNLFHLLHLNKVLPEHYVLAEQGGEKAKEAEKYVEKYINSANHSADAYSGIVLFSLQPKVNIKINSKIYTLDFKANISS